MVDLLLQGIRGQTLLAEPERQIVFRGNQAEEQVLGGQHQRAGKAAQPYTGRGERSFHVGGESQGGRRFPPGQAGPTPANLLLPDAVLGQHHGRPALVLRQQPQDQGRGRQLVGIVAMRPAAGFRQDSLGSRGELTLHKIPSAR
jgi:hypothetical protein